MLANPASQNCTAKGGKVTIEKNPQGGHFDGSCTRELASAPRTIAARFACAGGKSIDATFVNGAKASVRLALSDGRRLTLPQARSGSGARYASADGRVVFWNKGDTAFVEEDGKTTYDGCSTRA